MAVTKRYGRQTPTRALVLPYTETKGLDAVDLYNSSGRTSYPWQELLASDIMAVNEDGLWVHQKFGFSIPRRNGKNEVVVMREFYGLEHGENICHTAHRTTTSHSAWQRLRNVLLDAGYEELGRMGADDVPPDKSFKSSKQYGLETITLTNGGSIVFRTRTASGGLGEGFDLLIIDEAQEYTTEQEAALIYTVSDSPNPQTIFCGTPPTLTSAGTVFVKMREDCLLGGDTYDTGWAEWSVDEQPTDIKDVDLWYETNPSMGYHLDERKIRSEIRGDVLDFVIQRLGFWFRYNLKSAISEAEWDDLKVKTLPQLRGKLFAGVKYAADGATVALSIAVKIKDGVFVETIDDQSTRNGNGWILNFLKAAQVEKIVIDGAGNQQILADALKEARVKASVIVPSVGEVVTANAAFKQAVDLHTVRHAGQPSLAQSVTNCDKRAIGSRGGFGFKSIKEGVDISIMDSVILAYWICSTTKERRKQKARY